MKYVEYCEPLTCVNKEGVAYTGNQTIRVSVEDAVNFSRAMHLQKHGTCSFNDDELRDDFIVIHWAKLVE